MANLAICLFTRALIACLIFFANAVNAQSAAEGVYENVKDSIGTIFSINEENKKDSALGSGVAITKDLIATNCHVALAGNFVFVDINGETLLGKLFYYNQKRDLCLIQINGMPLKLVTIRPSSSVKIGEDVFAIGNPEGQMKTISKGIISNKLKEDGIELLQTDASISSGSSGGGLFDVDGKLIGITTKTLKEGENIAFAIPTELILAVISSKENIDSTTTQVDSKNSSAFSREPSAISKTTYAGEYNKLELIGYYGNHRGTY
jgi:serine protease Do